MARKLRLQYAGAVYHVLCRGDRREAIFRDDEDRCRFLETLAQMCGRTGQRVHSFVLMSNHYHLLLETVEPNLVAGMKWFQGTYTQRFNARHRLCGHLFQGRYKAVPVDPAATEYFLAASDYIHLNPARAGLLATADGSTDLLAYPWSSYPGFAQQAQLPVWQRRERVFRSLGLPDENAAARRRYQGYLAAKTREALKQTPTLEEQERWLALRRGWYLGGDGFRDELKERAAELLVGRQRSSYDEAESLRTHDERTGDKLLAAGLRRLGLRVEEAAALKQSDPRKQSLAWLVKSRTVVDDAWISTRLAMGHRSNVSRAVSAFRAPVDAHRRKLRNILRTCTD